MRIHIVTRNKEKLAAAQEAFSGSDIIIVPAEKDYPEIQADTSLEIARHTALEAAKEIGEPAIREDHSTYLNAIPSFPGPYGNYFNRKMSAAQFLKILEGEQDRSAFFELSAALAFPDGRCHEASYRVQVIIAEHPQGKAENDWDTFFMFPGEQKTFAETPWQERTTIWNRNFKELRRKLEEEAERPTTRR